MLNADQLYQMLLAAYGKPRWWSEDPFIVMFQSVLVQNTAWNNVEKTCAAIGDKLTPEYMESISAEELEQLIRPCGFCKGKTRTIKGLLAWYRKYGFDRESVRQVSDQKLRQELLSIRGIGEETADVILVYGFYKAFFIVDAYTRRLLLRLGYDFSDNRSVKHFFEAGLGKDAQLYGYCHWLILDHCISVCRKKPLCGKCCFQKECAQMNKTLISGT